MLVKCGLSPDESGAHAACANAPQSGLNLTARKWNVREVRAEIAFLDDASYAAVIMTGARET